MVMRPSPSTQGWSVSGRDRRVTKLWTSAAQQAEEYLADDAAIARTEGGAAAGVGSGALGSADVDADGHRWLHEAGDILVGRSSTALPRWRLRVRRKLPVGVRS